MHTDDDRFLWAEIADNRQMLLTALAIEKGKRGKWQPIQLDRTMRGWRLGTTSFEDVKDAKHFVQTLSERENKDGIPLMDIAPRIDGIYIVGVLALSGAVAALLPGIWPLVITNILWLSIWLESIRDVA